MYLHVNRSRYHSDDYQKIVGHSGAMPLTEKVYTYFDIKQLVDAINQI